MLTRGMEGDGKAVLQYDLLEATAEKNRFSLWQRYRSLADLGAGVGQFGHGLLALDPQHRLALYDGAGGFTRAREL